MLTRRQAKNSTVLGRGRVWVVALVLAAAIAGVSNTRASAIGHTVELGFWTLTPSGEVLTAPSQYFGDIAPVAGGAPIAITLTTERDGYWISQDDGTVTSFGGAGTFADVSGLELAAPVVDAAGFADADGMWLAGADGGVFALGEAPFLGSAGNLNLVEPIVAIASHPSGDGYWLVAADGGVFTYGTAAFWGSIPALGLAQLAQPITSIVATPTGNGYWLLAADGGVFAFGDATFAGSFPSASPGFAAAASYVSLIGFEATGYMIFSTDGVGSGAAFGVDDCCAVFPIQQDTVDIAGFIEPVP